MQLCLKVNKILQEYHMYCIGGALEGSMCGHPKIYNNRSFQLQREGSQMAESAVSNEQSYHFEGYLQVVRLSGDKLQPGLSPSSFLSVSLSHKHVDLS